MTDPNPTISDIESDEHPEACRSDRTEAAPATTPRTVGVPVLARDLSIDHHGHLIDLIGAHGTTQILLGGIRRWTDHGQDRIGLLDLSATSDGAFRGTERHVNAEMHVRIGERVKRGVPRARKGDYR
jgi:hypothetical protein